MAFNPFHGFRKHQKVFFAALTIICMLTFVMMGGSFAGGDAFSELSRLFGGRGRGAAEVASLYGKSITAPELIILREQRRLANNFMSFAVETAQQNIIEDLSKNVTEFDKPIQDEVRQIALFRQFAMQGYGSVQDYGQRLNQVLFRLSSLRTSLVTANKTNEANKVVRLQDSFQRDLLQLQRRDDLYPGHNLYFGGATTIEGLLDFMIWKHEADRLGIQLSPEDIRTEISRETWKSLPQDQASMILTQLVGRQLRGSAGELLTALGEEFRVRLARAALTGYDPEGFIQPPAMVSPAELWDYYRKNRTTVDVSMLPIKVERFLPLVKEEPTKEELTDLFEKYKDEEYAPFKATPGFKQPRRVRIEWVEASPESQSSRKAAHLWLVSLLAGSVSNPLQAAALVVPIANEYEYAKYSRLQIPGFHDGDFGRAFYAYASLQRPETIAATLGQVAGVVQAGGCPFAPVVSLEATAVAREAKALASAVEKESRNRVPRAVDYLASGASGNPLVAATTVAALSNPGVRSDHYLPFEVVTTQLLRTVEENLSKELVNSAFENFKQELEKHKTQREQFVKDEIARRGWKHGASEKLDDRYAIASDPGLKPLKDADDSGRLQTGRARDREFADRFFVDDTRAGQQPKLYAPQDLRTTATGGIFLYWKTQDDAAKVLSFNDAKAQVEKAWRLQKARALAEAEAKKIESECKTDSLTCLANAAKRLNEKLVDLDSISRLRRKLSARAGLGDEYEYYRVPEEKVEYPALDFVDQVLELKNTGEMKILSDAPIDTYYVAALAKRVEPTVREFEKDTSTFAFQRSSPFLGLLQEERRLEYRKGIMERLRQQAQLKIEDDRRNQVEERVNQ